MTAADAALTPTHVGITPQIDPRPRNHRRWARAQNYQRRAQSDHGAAQVPQFIKKSRRCGCDAVLAAAFSPTPVPLAVATDVATVAARFGPAVGLRVPRRAGAGGCAPTFVTSRGSGAAASMVEAGGEGLVRGACVDTCAMRHTNCLPGTVAGTRARSWQRGHSQAREGSRRIGRDAGTTCVRVEAA